MRVCGDVECVLSVCGDVDHMTKVNESEGMGIEITTNKVEAKLQA